MTTVRKSSIVKAILILISVIVVAAAAVGFLFWRAVYKNNVRLDQNESAYLFIKTGSDFDDLIKNIDDSGLLKNMNTFLWLAERKNLPNHIYPGRYEFKPGMNNEALVNMLRSGSQSPLNIIFNSLRTIDQMAGVVSKQIEADSTSIATFINSGPFIEKYGLNKQQAPAMFIPNTYEFYWNSSSEQFVERMDKEFNRFWDEDKKAKAKIQNLTPVEVSILASIVEKETNRNDEKATIAGVYLNRLKKGWKLQADPTTVFAFFLENDSILHRVYRKHTNMASPYNTYAHKGLPPGPICLPSLSSLNAVLNPENHEYMYFVAKADGSGYHHFSKTYKQHLRYAREHYEGLKNSN